MQGSVKEFNRCWNNPEREYNHWTRGEPVNQIQLAFRQHWLYFKKFLLPEYETCLEVGCGRGAISSYFADAGYKCTLLDTNRDVLKTARRIFEENGHRANFVQGDAFNLPFKDESFDVVVSIGLLEHFRDIEQPIKEQFRILRPGGLFIGYIVPGKPDKSGIYRTDYRAEHYINLIKGLDVTDIHSTGLYPLPMISRSPEFPFTLNSPFIESVIVKVFKSILAVRKLFTGSAWTCKKGQAFVVMFRRV